jgi:hypothetical protein
MSDVDADRAGSPDPALVLTVSRSGSALLRFILDASLPSWDMLENVGSGWQRLVTERALLLTDVPQTVRDSPLSADLLAETCPQARFVCLYRHCMDVIASGPEAVGSSGFCPYVTRYPGNTVAAIGSYWADTADMMLAFEDSHPGRCHRVRYEDLATAPAETAASLLSFLGLQASFTALGDADAIGRGVNVPGRALPPRLREQINQSLATLGYRGVGEDWSDKPGPLDPRLSVGTGGSTEPAAETGGVPAWLRQPPGWKIS